MKYGYVEERYEIISYLGNHITSNDYECEREKIPKKLLFIDDLIDIYIYNDIDKGKVKAYYKQESDDDEIEFIGYEVL